ncbi:TNF receptor-associated factor 3-like [Liolophura sinensis]|uniref:TNF receptor-associated factor 3-like n=1 Tax=Liolophura sinensis TaxID=3198878 RepID=UPI00315915B6
MMSLPSLPSLPPTPAENPDFVSIKEAEKYICILHNGVLRNAMQTSCGHRFCESCIHTYLQSGDCLLCPAKEEDCVELCSSGKNQNNIYPDSSARREILNLKVYCQYKKFGCKKTTAWKNLQNHTESCSFKRVSCSNGCGDFVAPDAMASHLENECSKRLVNCKNCGIDVVFDTYQVCFSSEYCLCWRFPYQCNCQPYTVSLNVFLLQRHIDNDCPAVLINCPYNCAVKPFQRMQLPQHLKACPNKPKPCKFQSAGCKFEGSSDAAVRKHEAENVQAHLDLLTIHFSSMEMENLEFKDVVKGLTAQKTTLAEQLQRQVEKNQELTTQVSKLQTSNKELQIRIVTLTERVITMERKLGDFAKKEDVDKCSEDVSTIQETLLTYDQRITEVESTGGSQSFSATMGGTEGVPGDLRTKLARQEQQIGIQDVRLAEMDIRFQILETASYNGQLMWKIRDYKRRKQEAISGKTISLYSQPFYMHRFSYKMCARVYLNGDGVGKGSHMSLFFVVMRGEFDALLEWPFHKRVNLMLLDQQSRCHDLSDSFQTDVNSSSFKRPATEMNVASGCPMFAPQSTVEQPPYLVEDTIFIKVTVEDLS